MDKIYQKIENYTMKCRLYPNKETAEKIDKAIAGVKVFYNCTLWEIFNNRTFAKEAKDKKDPEKTIHFVDYYPIAKKEWKNKLIEEHPIIDSAPAGAITSSVYGIVCDMKKSLGKNPIEFQKPQFYNQKHPRRSYSYQETFGKFTAGDNKNVMYVNLMKIGICKIRGVNQKIRFDENGEVDFAEYCAIHNNDRVGVTISKDNCGDYWICLKLQCVYVPRKIC